MGTPAPEISLVLSLISNTLMAKAGTVFTETRMPVPGSQLLITTRIINLCDFLNFVFSLNVVFGQDKISSQNSNQERYKYSYEPLFIVILISNKY